MYHSPWEILRGFHIKDSPRPLPRAQIFQNISQYWPEILNCYIKESLIITLFITDILLLQLYLASTTSRWIRYNFVCQTEEPSVILFLLSKQELIDQQNHPLGPQ